MVADYITTTNFKSRFGITTSGDDARIAAHVTAASLWVDSYCGRQFGPGTAGVTRYFEPDSWGLVRVDDCHTITEVAIDTTDDGTYSTILALGTDYSTLPRNGVGPNGQSGWPITQLEATRRTYWFPMSNWRPLSVKVTATFGWAAIPTDVIEATYLLAHRLYFEVDVPSGNSPGSLEFGGVPLRRPWTAQAILKDYVRADRKLGII
jgi:hypothetical protein